jgi:hypothetical protein
LVPLLVKKCDESFEVDVELCNCLVRASLDPNELVQGYLKENSARANVIGLKKINHLLGVFNTNKLTGCFSSVVTSDGDGSFCRSDLLIHCLLYLGRVVTKTAASRLLIQRMAF